MGPARRCRRPRDRRLLGVGRAPLRRARGGVRAARPSPTSPGHAPTPWRVALAGRWPAIREQEIDVAARAPRRRCCAAGSARGSTRAPRSSRGNSACGSTARSPRRQNPLARAICSATNTRRFRARCRTRHHGPLSSRRRSTRHRSPANATRARPVRRNGPRPASDEAVRAGRGRGLEYTPPSAGRDGRAGRRAAISFDSRGPRSRLGDRIRGRRGSRPTLSPLGGARRLRRATALAADGGRILSYGTGAGYTPLRELLGEKFDVHSQRVLLTNGWLQGFALIVERRVSAQKVVVDLPDLRPRAAAAVRLGRRARLPRPARGRPSARRCSRTRCARSPSPRLAYTTPTFHNPTGLSLSIEERTASARCSVQRGTLIVEDDSYGLLRYEGEPLPTMFELSERTIVYSTSFSHTIAPGLRVGVFILPDELSAELATKANSTYITPVLLGQATAFEFLRGGSFEPNLERLKARAARAPRHDARRARAAFRRLQLVAARGRDLHPASAAARHERHSVIERAEGVTADAGAISAPCPTAMRLQLRRGRARRDRARDRAARGGVRQRRPRPEPLGRPGTVLFR